MLSVYAAGEGANDRSADQSAAETKRSRQGARRGPLSAEARLLQMVGNRAKHVNKVHSGPGVAISLYAPVTTAWMKSP